MASESPIARHRALFGGSPQQAVESDSRRATTADAVREIIRRYRETFERLGR